MVDKNDSMGGGRLGGVERMRYPAFKPGTDMPVALDGKMSGTGTNNHRKDNAKVRSPAKFGNSI